MKNFSTLVLLALFNLGHSYTVNIKGRVISPTSSPISNAQIDLGQSEFKTQTDSLGVFSIIGEIEEASPIFNSQKNARLNLAVSNSNLSLVIPLESKINLSLFNLQGQLIKTLVNENFSPGIIEIANWNSEIQSGTYILSLSTQWAKKSLKVYNTHSASGSQLISKQPLASNKELLASDSLDLSISAIGYNNHNKNLINSEIDLGDITLDYNAQSLALIDSVKIITRDLDIAMINPMMTTLLRKGDSLMENISKSYGNNLNYFYLNNGFNYLTQGIQNIILPAELDTTSGSYATRLFRLLQTSGANAIDSSLVKIKLSELTYQEFIDGHYFVSNTSTLPPKLDTLINKQIAAIENSYTDPSRNIFDKAVEPYVAIPLMADLGSVAKLSAKASNIMPLAKGLFSVAQGVWGAYSSYLLQEKLDKMDKNIDYIKEMTEVLTQKVDVIDQKLDVLANNMSVIDQNLNLALDKMAQNHSEILYLQNMENRADLRSFRVAFSGNNSQENAHQFWQPHYASIIKYINGASIYNSDSIAKLPLSQTQTKFSVNIPFKISNNNCIYYSDTGSKLYCQPGTIDSTNSIKSELSYTKAQYLLPMSFADLEYLAEIIMFQFNLSAALYGADPALSPKKSMTLHNKETATAILQDLQPIKTAIQNSYNSFVNKSLYGLTGGLKFYLNDLANNWTDAYLDDKYQNFQSIYNYSRELSWVNTYKGQTADVPFFTTMVQHYTIISDYNLRATAKVDDLNLHAFDPGNDIEKMPVRMGTFLSNTRPTTYGKFQWKSNVANGLAGLDESGVKFANYYKSASSELFDFAIRLSALELYLQSFINAEELIVK